MEPKTDSSQSSNEKFELSKESKIFTSNSEEKAKESNLVKIDEKDEDMPVKRNKTLKPIINRSEVVKREG